MKNLLILLTLTGIVFITTCKKESKNLPVASFTYSPSSPGAGDTIYFQSNCQNTNSLEWDFGDGKGSSDENPVHAYADEGNYSVQLTAHNNDGSHMTSKNIVIKHSCWKKLINLPTSRNTHVSIILDNKIYVAGGVTTWNEFEAYNISTNGWEVKADMPNLDREFLAGCALNGKIYLIGGWYGLEGINDTDILEEYDPATDKWTTRTPMPTKRWGHVAYPINGKIYVIGGAYGWPIEKFYKTIEIYDPMTDSWTTLEPEGGYQLTNRWGQGSCMVDGKVYFIGGTDALNGLGGIGAVPALNIVEVYDVESNTWSKRSSMPTKRMGLVSVAVNNKIYAIGGCTEYEPAYFALVVEEYDPVTDIWVSKAPMPYGIICPAACQEDNIIYISGGDGFDEYDVKNYFYSYDPVCDTVSE